MTQTPGTRENRSGFLAPTLMTVAMLALLVSLGIWQLQRMAWKEGLIAGIAARAHGSPVALSETDRKSVV